MLTRGTTPYHSFLLPFAVEDINEIYITYMQNNEVVIEKTLSDIEIDNVDQDTLNGFIFDENKGDFFSSNDSEQEEDETTYSQAIAHLSQEDTLAFKFYPAAEKNIAVIQIRVLTQDGEAYASMPVRERIFGVLKEGIIGGK